MTIAAYAYGTVAAVAAYVRYMTNAAGTFDPSTKPSLAEVEGFINRRSSLLNAALTNAGYSPPLTNAGAVDILSYYVAQGAAGDCELSYRYAGNSADDLNRRENKFLAEFKEGLRMLRENPAAFLGVPAGANEPPGGLAGLRVGGTTRGGLGLRPVFGRTGFDNDPTFEAPSHEADYTP